MRGDLRTVYADTGRWIALVTPESQRAKKANEDGVQLASGDDQVEFRRAYVVRVNLAGKFMLPSVAIERSVPPVKTMLSSRSSLQVKPPESSSK